MLYLLITATLLTIVIQVVSADDFNLPPDVKRCSAMSYMPNTDDKIWIACQSPVNGIERTILLGYDTDGDKKEDYMLTYPGYPENVTCLTQRSSFEMFISGSIMSTPNRRFVRLASEYSGDSWIKASSDPMSDAVVRCPRVSSYVTSEHIVLSASQAPLGQLFEIIKYSAIDGSIINRVSIHNFTQVTDIAISGANVVVVGRIESKAALAIHDRAGNMQRRRLTLLDEVDDAIFTSVIHIESNDRIFAGGMYRKGSVNGMGSRGGMDIMVVEFTADGYKSNYAATFGSSQDDRLIELAYNRDRNEIMALNEVSGNIDNSFGGIDDIHIRRIDLRDPKIQTGYFVGSRGPDRAIAFTVLNNGGALILADYGGLPVLTTVSYADMTNTHSSNSPFLGLGIALSVLFGLIFCCVCACKCCSPKSKYYPTGPTGFGFGMAYPNVPVVPIQQTVFVPPDYVPLGMVRPPQPVQPYFAQPPEQLPAYQA